MGAVPVLIMLAAVGVDYGWQPDGTSSPRGDNVEYIIQIPPHQLEQLRSAGEITSAVDPSIQGRVSRIVVKVGRDPLPRDAGRATPDAAGATASSVTHAVAIADDASQIPIPEIAADSLAQAISDPADTPGSESLMKPDPQAGGYALPESLGNSVRTNPAVSTDPAEAGRDDSWGDIGERTGSSASRSPSAANGRVGTTGAGPSTDPVDSAERAPAFTRRGNDGPRADGAVDANSGANPAAADRSNQPTASAPLGSGSNAPNIHASAGASGHRPTDPSDPNWSGYGTTPNFGTLPPGLSPAEGISRPQHHDPSAGPSAYANAAGDAQRRAIATTSASSDPEVKNFGRDSAGNPLDQLGRPIDRQGRVIDPDTGHLVDSSGNWIDETGRLIDRLGRPLAREPGSGSGRSGNVNLEAPLPPSQRPDPSGYAQSHNPPSAYGQPERQVNGQPNYTQPPQTTQPPYVPSGQTNQANPANPAGYQGAPGHGAPVANPARPQYAGEAGYPSNNAYPPIYPSATEPVNHTQSPVANEPRQAQAGGTSRSGGSYDEDDFRSPSDFRRGTSDRGGSQAREPDRDPVASEPGLTAGNPRRTVAAQPFFNFVLLISLVGNAYLIYETGNLRRKFRNMIANVRASKLAAQPAG